MTLALRNPEPALKLFVGPPGTSKTATLAKEIDHVVRTGANPYTLFVACPFRSGASALRDRVTKLSGTTRSSRYQFRTFKEVLSYQGKQLPSVSIPEDRYLLDLILGSYSAAGGVPEFLSPNHCIDRACFLPHSVPWSIFFSALYRLGLVHPYELLFNPDLPSLTAEYIFIDDLHLLPSAATEWINVQRANGAAVIATLDPHYQGSTPFLAALEADIHTLNRPRKATSKIPVTYRNNDLPKSSFDSIEDEIEDIVVSISSIAPPEVLICASPILQAHVLVRAALRGVTPRSPASDSVYSSREIRYLCAALEATLFNGSAGIRSLLNLLGIDVDELYRSLTAAGVSIGLTRLVSQPSTFDVPSEYARHLTEFSNAYRNWRSLVLPSERLEAICRWLQSSDQFPQPHLFDIVLSEYRREEPALSSSNPLKVLYDRLLSCLRFDDPAIADGPATLITDVSSLLGHYYENAHISLSHSGDIDFADEFMYLAVSHTGASRRITLSPPESLASLSGVRGGSNA